MAGPTSSENFLAKEYVDFLDMRRLRQNLVHAQDVPKNIPAAAIDVSLAPGDVWKSFEDRKFRLRVAYGEPGTGCRFVFHARKDVVEHLYHIAFLSRARFYLDIEGFRPIRPVAAGHLDALV